MKTLLFEIERFLRWLSDLPADQLASHGADISEASQAFAEQLEPIVDSMDDDDTDNGPADDGEAAQ
jgi:hypothetical protein